MKETSRITVPLGDLIAALYDEAKKETKVEKFQSAIVALALADFHCKIIRSKHIAQRKHKKVA